MTQRARQVRADVSVTADPATVGAVVQVLRTVEHLVAEGVRGVVRVEVDGPALAAAGLEVEYTPRDVSGVESAWDGDRDDGAVGGVVRVGG